MSSIQRFLYLGDVLLKSHCCCVWCVMERMNAYITKLTTVFLLYIVCWSKG